MNTPSLQDYGLSDRFLQESKLFSSDLFLARVTRQDRTVYKVASGNGEFNARVSGKMIHQALSPVDFPTVGDWVMIDRNDVDKGSGDAIIHHVLTRKSVLERKAAGDDKESQIIAANIDLIFICMALNDDYNLRRLERYIAIGWDSGATPVVVLTKSDLSENYETQLQEIKQIALGIDVICTSSQNPHSYQELFNYVVCGKTIAFVGSSGVGKSTLINLLSGEQVMETREIRADGKGRHTTTHRQLFVLSSGGVVIDTPGMRELQVDSADLSRTFEDIESLAAHCKFRNCTHTGEPGCKIQQAIDDGSLSPDRVKNYNKLLKELAYNDLSSREVEHAKIKNMVGGLNIMKKLRNEIKKKNQ